MSHRLRLRRLQETLPDFQRHHEKWRDGHQPFQTVRRLLSRAASPITKETLQSWLLASLLLIAHHCES